GNRFLVRLLTDGDGARLAAALAAPMAEIARRGVPNYFGPQRFGRDGANLARAAEDLRRLAPQERGFVLSAARSAVFNAVLAAQPAARGARAHVRARSAGAGTQVSPGARRLCDRGAARTHRGAAARTDAARGALRLTRTAARRPRRFRRPPAGRRRRRGRRRCDAERHSRRP